MTKTVYRVTGTLRAVAPLHVGSGDTRHVATVKGKEGSGKNQQPEVLAIVRDAVGRPYIPPTALKGLLRRLCEATFGLGSTQVIDLMGKIKSDQDPESGGQMGAVLLRGAAQVGQTPNACQMPFADPPGTAYEAEKTLGPGIFVAARTRIDSASGAAAQHKLFHMEMVAEKTEFAFEVLVEVRGGESERRAQSLKDDLLKALKLLASPEGASIGKGQADGFGAIRLLPQSLKVDVRHLTAAGDFRFVPEASLWANDLFEAKRDSKNLIRLRCDGPFVVMDSSYTPPPRLADGDDRDRVQIKAQRISERMPLLLATSVSGALRERARWLAGLDALRSPGGAMAVDDPDTVVSSAEEASKLTAVQQLFGVTGFRSLLTIRGLRISEANPWNVTSVKIDRFSGAPVDNALFTTQGFLGIAISFEIVFDETRFAHLSKSQKKSGAEALFQRLLDDVRKNGLELGHGGSKGFGWFESVGDAA